MVSIRFFRVGRPGIALYRLGAVDSRRSCRFPPLEVFGQYDPKAQDGEKIKNLKKERLDYWLGTGAQLSDSASRLLKKEKIIASADPAPKTVTTS